MKAYLLSVLFLLSAGSISAQLIVFPGAQFSMTGNIQLTLHNTDLANSGSFTAGNSVVSFTGSLPSSISGREPIQFNVLQINKSNNSAVLLQRSVGIQDRIHFISGFLDLNGFNADLGTTGHLDGEAENTRIVGPNGGVVLFNVNLNSPAGSNPANLGIFITSGQDLANVTIRRGHQSQVNGVGLGNSILRYYDIVPANNTNLNASLRFKYMDAELNSLDENSIVLFESQNNINWTSLGITSRDVVGNFVEKTGINSFGRFTLSSIGNVLPVHFVLFNANCDNGRVRLTWKTAQEQNSQHFNVERSTDGISWTVIGTVLAAGTSGSERDYNFRDNNPGQNSFYRIAEYDQDGRMQLTGTIRSSCTVPDVFNVWPNPVRDQLFINIVATNDSKALIRVFDSKGALVKRLNTAVLPGNNQYNIDMSSMAKGMYTLSVYWNNGQISKTVQVVKQ